MYCYDKDEFEFNGRTYVAYRTADDDSDPPWQREDCHGPVSDWRTGRVKRAGERELCYDRGSRRYYDWAEAMKIARRDGWGLGEKQMAALVKRLENKRRFALEFDDERRVTKCEERQDRDCTLNPPTKGEIAAEAVRLDFERLRGWCNEYWGYIGVIVEHVPNGCEASDQPADYAHACWGIESDGDYWMEVRDELASEIDAKLNAELMKLYDDREKNATQHREFALELARATPTASRAILMAMDGLKVESLKMTKRIEEINK